MQTRTDALNQIRDLMNQHQLELNDIAQFIKQPSPQGSILVQLMTYLGGALILCGICVFVSMQWEAMSSITRVLVTLGSGFTVYAVALCLLSEPKFERLLTPLFIVAALLEVGGLFVFLDEYFTPTGHWEPASMLVFGAVGTQFGLTFYAIKRSALLFVSFVCVTCFLGSWFEHMNMQEHWIGILLGAGLLGAGFLTHTTSHKQLTPFLNFFGAVMFLWGLFDLVEGSLLEILYVLANVGLVYASILQRSRTLLFVSIVAFFSYMSYLAFEHFVDSIGAPLAFIGMGCLLFALSALALKLNRKYFKSV